MKIYTNTFDLRQPTEKKFWVAPYSDFKIGIRVLGYNGTEIPYPPTSIELYKDGTKLTVDSNNGNMAFWKIKSEGTGEVTYTVKAKRNNKVVGELKLIQSVTDSTVYEQESGGEIPSDLDVDSINVNSASVGTLTVPNANFSVGYMDGTAMTTIGPVTIDGCTGEGKFNTIRTNDTTIGGNYIQIQSNGGAKMYLTGGCGSEAYLEIHQDKIIRIQPNQNIDYSDVLVFKPVYMSDLNNGCGGYVLAAFI